MSENVKSFTSGLITITVVGAIFSLGYKIMGEIQAEAATIPADPVVVPAPPPIIHLAFATVVLVVGVGAIQLARHHRRDLQTEIDPIARYKIEYVNDEISLEEYEHRVYEAIEVDIPEP